MGKVRNNACFWDRVHVLLHKRLQREQYWGLIVLAGVGDNFDKKTQKFNAKFLGKKRLTLTFLGKVRNNACFWDRVHVLLHKRLQREPYWGLIVLAGVGDNFDKKTQKFNANFLEQKRLRASGANEADFLAVAITNYQEENRGPTPIGI